MKKKSMKLLLGVVCLLSIIMVACSSNKNNEELPKHVHLNTGYLPFLDGFENAEIKYAKLSGSEKNGRLVTLNEDVSYKVLTAEQVSEFEGYFKEIMLGWYCEECEPSYTYDYVIVTSTHKDDVFAVDIEGKSLYWIANDTEKNEASIYNVTLSVEEIDYLKDLFQ